MPKPKNSDVNFIIPPAVFFDWARLCSPPAEQQGRLTEGLIEDAYEYRRAPDRGHLLFSLTESGAAAGRTGAAEKARGGHFSGLAFTCLRM
jgi:hypothetical protein